MARKPAGGRAALARDTADSHGWILLVEDDGDLRDITSALLRKLGYEVEAVATFATARDKASERMFDVLIADIRLPDGNGLELLGSMRAQNAKLNGIAVSGMDSDADAAMHAGFAMHLKKPFEFADLRAAVQRMI